LNKEAAESLLAYFAKIKMNNTAGHEHEHECVKCSDAFTCKQSMCDATLKRYCDSCARQALGEME
jgi:hypothetical protein